jgi:hypothetical protein
MVATLMVLGVIAAGCGWKPGAPAPPPPDACANSDGPSNDTVEQAIDDEPAAVAGSTWTETGRGHTRNCRLFWVQIAPKNATASSPTQLLFFDHDIPLGSPTPNPKPYTTVMSSGDASVTVQYQWQVGGDAPERPTGIGTVRYRIGPDGTLSHEDPIPNQ